MSRELLCAGLGGAAVVLAAQWALGAFHHHDRDGVAGLPGSGVPRVPPGDGAAAEAPAAATTTAAAAAAAPALPLAHDDAAAAGIMEEQLSRCSTFFGEAAFAKIRSAFVIVVGLGGVGAPAPCRCCRRGCTPTRSCPRVACPGSHAAHMLARSGVRRMRLIDFDRVSLSSLNRHATAVRVDVSTPKSTALAAAIRYLRAAILRFREW
jgi:hypothetical protein